MMELDADYVRRFFPDAMANVSDGELAQPIRESSDIYKGSDITVQVWLCAHLYEVRRRLAEGEVLEGGLESTRFGQHYRWRLRGAPDANIGIGL